MIRTRKHHPYTWSDEVPKRGSGGYYMASGVWRWFAACTCGWRHGKQIDTNQEAEQLAISHVLEHAERGEEVCAV